MYKTKVLGIDMKQVLIYAFVAIASLLFISYVHAAQPNFIQDLKEGSEGDDVAALQTLLESKGYLTMPQGVAKGYFGARTRVALAKYQQAMGIAPAFGYFGPMTRAKILAEFNGSIVTNTSNTTNVDPSKPLITNVTVTGRDTINIIGRGFSSVLNYGKMNTIVVGNSSKTKMLVLTQVPSQFSGTNLEARLPAGWINAEILSVSVRNDATGQVSNTYVGTTTAMFIDPNAVLNTSGGNNYGGAAPVHAPATSPTPSGSGQSSYNDSGSNLANIWSAVQAFLQ